MTDVTGQTQARTDGGRTPKIRMRDVHKRFGPKIVLDGVDLDVMPNESFVIIGGSGSGKSVSLKCILGLLKPEQGTIEVDGQNMDDLGPRERDKVLRKFGMLFQGAALFDSMPVWENVCFGLLATKAVKRKEARDVAIEKLALVGLGPG
jgi:phospholipid/cholesterol/gamma-HCH transport system ATP-binding protein